MDLFRIAKSRYIEALNGEGARVHGGRWNKKGISIIYTSEHESLAILEVLVHTAISTLPTDLKIMVLSLPDDVTCEEIVSRELPTDWRTYPAPERLAEMGADWIQSDSSLLLKVPSVIVPSEFNFLINPEHEEFSKVHKKEIRNIELDERLSR